MLRPGTVPEDGIINPTADSNNYAGIRAGNLPLYNAIVQKLIWSYVEPEYLQFLEHPILRETVRSLMGWDKEVLLKRTMLRHNIPGGLNTDLHYDKLFLRNGARWGLGSYGKQICYY